MAINASNAAAFAGDVGTGLAEVLPQADYLPAILKERKEAQQEGKANQAQVQKDLDFLSNIKIHPADQKDFLKYQQDLYDWTKNNIQRIKKDPAALLEFQSRMGKIRNMANISMDRRTRAENADILKNPKQFYDSDHADYEAWNNKPTFDDNNNPINAIPRQYMPKYDWDARFEKAKNDFREIAKSQAQDITPESSTVGGIPILTTGKRGEVTKDQAENFMQGEVNSPEKYRHFYNEFIDTNPDIKNPSVKQVQQFAINKYAPQLQQKYDDTHTTQAWSPYDREAARANEAQVKPFVSYGGEGADDSNYQHSLYLEYAKSAGDGAKSEEDFIKGLGSNKPKVNSITYGLRDSHNKSLELEQHDFTGADGKTVVHGKPKPIQPYFDSRKNEWVWGIPVVKQVTSTKDGVPPTFETEFVPLEGDNATYVRDKYGVDLNEVNKTQKFVGQSSVAPQQPAKNSIKRSDIPMKAKAAGYSAKEYEKLLTDKGIKIE